MSTNTTDFLELAKGTLTRVIAFRLKPGTDLLLGLEAAVKEAGINNGVIVSGIGSLDGVRYCNPVEIEDAPAGYGYGEPLILTGPIELVGLSGIICHDSDGVTNLHVHVSLSDRYGVGHGGHLVEGTKVLLTTDVVVAELGGGIIMSRAFDPSLGVPCFAPKQGEE
ncbi:MAG: DNA-binding protein [Eubacteriales bacterium]|nr:DNA-binding protein [Eubacteriales bacterium]